MRKLIAIITLFGVFMFAFVGFSTIKAFIIYEANYDDDSILQLPLAKKDALNLKEALSKIPDSQITLLENPTAGEFIREFKKWMNSTSPQDTLIVYYAGHGISKDGKFYFIPADADPEDSYTWIPFERLERYIKEDRKIVWLIDACYSGAMVKGRPLRAVRIQKEALHAQGEQVIITSSSGNEISREMPDGSGGLFTVSLVKALQGGADKDKDGWIESGELYEYVKEQVSKLSQNQQHPVMKGKKDIKLVADISEKIEKLKMELFKAYDAGEISELAFKNVKALIEGKSCEGEVVKDLKEAIDGYLTRKITLKMLILVIKPYGDKITCQGVKKEKAEKEKKPKEKEQVHSSANVVVEWGEGTVPYLFAFEFSDENLLGVDTSKLEENGVDYREKNGKIEWEWVLSYPNSPNFNADLVNSATGVIVYDTNTKKFLIGIDSLDYLKFLLTYGGANDPANVSRAVANWIFIILNQFIDKEIIEINDKSLWNTYGGWWRAIYTPSFKEVNVYNNTGHDIKVVLAYLYGNELWFKSGNAEAERRWLLPLARRWSPFDNVDDVGRVRENGDAYIQFTIDVNASEIFVSANAAEDNGEYTRVEIDGNVVASQSNCANDLEQLILDNGEHTVKLFGHKTWSHIAPRIGMVVIDGDVTVESAEIYPDEYGDPHPIIIDFPQGVSTIEYAKDF